MVCDLIPPYFRYTIRLIRPFPNIDIPWVKPLRRKAAALLQLKPGDRVLDAGCGPGACFPYLAPAVGTSGEVVGLEISPEVAINARRRIEKNGWRNVRLVLGDARNVRLEGKFDALLMFGVSDIYGSPAALDNLIPYLKADARVVVFGAKLTRRRMGLVLNPALRLFWKTTLPTTPALSHEPWTRLEERWGSFPAQDQWFGCMFLGSLRNRRSYVGQLRPAGRYPFEANGGN